MRLHFFILPIAHPILGVFHALMYECRSPTYVSDLLLEAKLVVSVHDGPLRAAVVPMKFPLPDLYLTVFFVLRSRIE